MAIGSFKKLFNYLRASLFLWATGSQGQTPIDMIKFEFPIPHLVNQLTKCFTLEQSDPRAALEEYADLKRTNQTYHPEILLAAIACPIIAAEIAWSLTILFHFHRDLGIAITLAVVGFAPGYLIYYRRHLQPPDRALGWNPERRTSALKSDRLRYLTLALAVNKFKNVFLVSMVAFVAAVIASPVLFIIAFFMRCPVAKIPPVIVLPIVIMAFVVATAFMFSHTMLPLRPFSEYLRGMIVDLKLGLGLFFNIAAGLAVSCLLAGGGFFGWFFVRRIDLFMAAGASGLLLGLSIVSAERSVLMANLIRLGEARCLVRLNRRLEARYRLNEILNCDSDFQPKSLMSAADVLLKLAPGDFTVPAQAYIDLSELEVEECPESVVAPNCPSFWRRVAIPLIAVFAVTLLWLASHWTGAFVGNNAITEDAVGGNEVLASVLQSITGKSWSALVLCYGFYQLLRVLYHLAGSPRWHLKDFADGLGLQVLVLGGIVFPLVHLIFVMGVSIPVAVIVSVAERWVRGTDFEIANCAVVSVIITSVLYIWYALWRFVLEGPTYHSWAYSLIPSDLWNRLPRPDWLLLIGLAILLTVFLSYIGL
jgi:hypothetical protein